MCNYFKSFYKKDWLPPCILQNCQGSMFQVINRAKYYQTVVRLVYTLLKCPKELHLTDLWRRYYWIALHSYYYVLWEHRSSCSHCQVFRIWKSVALLRRLVDTTLAERRCSVVNLDGCRLVLSLVASVTIVLWATYQVCIKRSESPRGKHTSN